MDAERFIVDRQSLCLDRAVVQAFLESLEVSFGLAVRCPGSFLAVAKTLAAKKPSQPSGKKQVRRVLVSRRPHDL